MGIIEKDRKDKLSCNNVMCFHFSQAPRILETQNESHKDSYGRNLPGDQVGHTQHSEFTQYTLENIPPQFRGVPEIANESCDV